MALTTTDGQQWADISPQPDDRKSTCNRFYRFGMARARNSRDGGFDCYGIFGIRGSEIFAQYEGRELGSVRIGVSVVAGDTDSNCYVWYPADGFTDTRVFGDLYAGALRVAAEHAAMLLTLACPHE